MPGSEANMPKKVLILGTGGNCVDILDAINEINLAAQEIVFECVGFLDDDPARLGREYHGVRVLGPLDSAPGYPDCCFVCGIGSEANFWRRDEIIRKTGMPLESFVTIVHPTASISRMSRLGRGTVILQNATVASNATIGSHVMILPNSIISHDGRIGDFTCIAGGACVSGGVEVGALSYLGTNSAVIGNVKIGTRCLIGMGSVVLRDVPDESVVVGNPARFLRKTR